MLALVFLELSREQGEDGHIPEMGAGRPKARERLRKIGEDSEPSFQTEQQRQGRGPIPDLLSPNGQLSVG